MNEYHSNLFADIHIKDNATGILKKESKILTTDEKTIFSREINAAIYGVVSILKKRFNIVSTYTILAASRRSGLIDISLEKIRGNNSKRLMHSVKLIISCVHTLLLKISICFFHLPFLYYRIKIVVLFLLNYFV